MTCVCLLPVAQQQTHNEEARLKSNEDARFEKQYKLTRRS